MDHILIGNIGSPSIAFLRPEHDIVDRHHAQQAAVAIDDRQAPDFCPAHGFQHGSDIVVGRTHLRGVFDDLACGNLPGRRVPGAQRDADVAVGNHPDYRPGVVHERKRAAVVFPHQRAGGSQARLGPAGYRLVVIMSLTFISNLLAV